ncbi:hypothetical protein BTO30_09050 [Domibacillus antri]|uniref:Uncharacterized protein n=1 Tax=Domibacillus antri TaxID=1714264 RepID=A0A1Q8Q599_9BACI|nr:hypothetical protein BTO30_09050 [Domibacillus antri]
MKKLSNFIVPLFFIVFGIACLTMSSTAFHTHNPLHHLLESLLGICLFLCIPVMLGIVYMWFKKRKK